MNNVLSNKKTRRSFLKNAGKTSMFVAVGGLALVGCGSKKSNAQNGISTSKKKKEILYRSTKYWNSYYASAK